MQRSYRPFAKQAQQASLLKKSTSHVVSKSNSSTQQHFHTTPHTHGGISKKKKVKAIKSMDFENVSMREINPTYKEYKRLPYRYPRPNTSSYPHYGRLLNRVHGMTDDMVAELERIQRNSSALAFSAQGGFLNEHVKEVPHKNEVDISWWRARHKILDEWWMTRWMMGITPYQRLQMRMKDRINNLKLLKHKQLPKSQPQFVPNIEIQQFHSPETEGYFKWLRKQQYQDENLIRGEPGKKRADYTPLPNLNHEDIENEEDELLGLVDVSSLNLDQIEISRDEIRRMYTEEAKVSTFYTNRVKRKMKKEIKKIREIYMLGPREYMLKHNLVDVDHDPTFVDEVATYKAASRVKQQEEAAAERSSSILEPKDAEVSSLVDQFNSYNPEEDVEDLNSMINDFLSDQQQLKSKKSLASIVKLEKRLKESLDKASTEPQVPFKQRLPQPSVHKKLIPLIRQMVKMKRPPSEIRQKIKAFIRYCATSRQRQIEELKKQPFDENNHPVDVELRKNPYLRFYLKMKNFRRRRKWPHFKDSYKWIIHAQHHSKRKRIREIYNLNAQAGRERQAYGKNLWVPDNSRVPDAYSEEDFGKLYPIPLKDWKRCFGTTMKRAPIMMQYTLSSSRIKCLMVREQILPIVSEVDRVQYCRYTPEGRRANRGFVFTGIAGGGKTCLLVQAIHHCFRKGFLIFHVPNGFHWAKGKHYIEPSAILPGYYDAPEPTKEFLKGFLKTNRAVLSQMMLTQDYGLECDTRESGKMRTLLDLVEFAVAQDLSSIGVPFKLILDEISYNKEFPMLFAIDGYNHLLETTAFKYGNLLRFAEMSPRKVHSNRLVLMRGINRMLLDNDNNKLFICAHTRTQESRIHLRYDKNILTPIDVPRYNAKEMRTMLDYYCFNHFIHRPTKEYYNDAVFLTGGVGSKVFQEVSKESF